MVQVSFDTNADTLEELEHALHLLQQAIERRGKPLAKAAPKLDMPVVEAAEEAPQEEVALDTGFLKITVGHDEAKDVKSPAKVPTLNEMIEAESLDDEDFSKLFKEQLATEHQKEKPKKTEDAYIEIIEYADEK